MRDDTTLPILARPARLPSRLEQLADIPEEEIWLQKQKSARTRRAYRLDVQHFMRTLAITAAEELRQADHKAVIAWERFMRETERAAASTIRRRLAALSSLYKHLVRHGHAARNPVGEVERPAINRDEGSTLAFAKAQARKLLDLPAEETIAGLRDRAILFQEVADEVAGLRAAGVQPPVDVVLAQFAQCQFLLIEPGQQVQGDQEPAAQVPAGRGREAADRGAAARLPRCRRPRGRH